MTSSISHNGCQLCCHDLPAGWGIWEELQTRLTTVGVADALAWNRAFATAYQDSLDFSCLVVREGDVVRGVMLVGKRTVRRARVLAMRQAYLGPTGEPADDSYYFEHVRPLVELGYEDAFWAAVRAWFVGAESCDTLFLNGVADDESAAFQRHFPDATRETRRGYVFDFDKARSHDGGLAACLGKSTRSNVRRLARAAGDVETFWAETPSDVHAVVDEMIPLNRARWESHGRSSFEGRFEDFLRDAIDTLVPEKKMIAFRVRDHQGTIGTLLHLVDHCPNDSADDTERGGRLLDYLAGVTDFGERKSPGVLCHWLCMQEALERGYRSYDFLPGEKRHKKNLSTDEYDMSWWSVHRPSWKRTLITAVKRS